MKVYKAMVYRAYEVEVEFNEGEVPEVYEVESKAEFLSRGIDIDKWTLVDVSADIFGVNEVS